MRWKNATPFRVAMLTTSRKPPEPEASVVVRGRFTLAPGVLEPHDDQGRISGEVFDDDDPDCAGAALKPSDLAHFKLRAEVLLTGVCHAPGGKPTPETFVRVGLAHADGKPWLKIDRKVLGPRVWKENLVGQAYTDPLPFTTMPLGWAQSFGGKGHEPNPVGKGIGTHELPNVEWPEGIKAKGDRPEPACPGPISGLWPQRLAKMGKAYGPDYQKKRAPFFAEDFDWSYFQSAPRSQQLEGYLRGDEHLELVNLHPTIGHIEAQLPALRLRVFVRDLQEELREVPMALDTIHVDSELGVVDLCWRGITSARERDLSDLAFGIIAPEPLAARALPRSHYEERMRAFLDDPLGMREAIPEHLRPLFDRAQALAKQEQAPPPEGTSPLEAEVLRMASALPEEEATKLIEAVRAMMKTARELHEQAVQTAREADKPAPAPLDETLAKAVAEAKQPKEPRVDFAPDGKPRVRLAETVAAQRAMLEGLRAQSELPAEAKAKLDPAIAEAQSKLDDPRLAELDPTLRGEAALVDLGPDRDLCHRDLRGRDLSGMKLSGSDLSRALLSGANLRGADLRGCKLDVTLLSEANLEGADLRGANLDRCILLRARLSGAKLDRATIHSAVLAHAVLDGASLDGVKGSLFVATGASLVGAKLRGADFLQSDLSEAQLGQADFTGAALVRCLLSGAKAHGAVFERAQLGHVSFEGAELVGAKLRKAVGPHPSFIRADLTRADFSGAVLPGAHFSEAHGEGCVLDRANLPEARFYRTRLVAPRFVGANLMSADLSLANMPRARFTDANLFDTKFLQTAGEGCDFVGANLTRSTLEGA